MAKRIAFIGDAGSTYEAIPFDNTYPTGAITISEDVNGQAGDLARFENAAVSDSFDERGICKLYKDGVFNRYFIFDHLTFFYLMAQGGFNVYLWKKVQLSDVTTEQTLVTGSGELSLANLDSGQSALPTFSGTVLAAIGTAFQDRAAYISTPATVSGGNVTFGVKLSTAGPSGTPYFDIIVIQL